MYYVDTSVLMPYTLTRKMEPERHQKAEQLFALADTGKLSLATSLYALVELYAVVLGKISNLHAASEVTKKAITSIFRRKISLLPLPNRLDKSMYSRKLSVLQDTADLSHTVSAIVNGCQGIITYDTHFLVIKDVIPTHSPDDVIAEIRRSTPVSSVPITKPFFDDAEKEAVIKPLETGWVVQGPNVAEFERIFAEYTGAKYAKATTSCTTALHLALIACGISEGDEVIVPAFTYVASANAVEYQKAKPVFVDIDIKTFNLDVEQLEQKITDKTKAIMPVHLFGLCADMEPILQIAEQYNLAVIEDAACAVGSLYKGIATRQGTHAVHALGYYKKKYNLTEQDYPMAWKADRQSMTLPLYPQMTEEEQEYVLSNIKEIISHG